MLELIRRVRDAGLPVVLISHNMPHVFEVADRIHVHRLGKRAAVSEPQEDQHERHRGGHDRRQNRGESLELPAERPCLKASTPCCTPELLEILMAMGHDDALVLADANFTAQSIAAANR